jgi:hypothetical protein
LNTSTANPMLHIYLTQHSMFHNHRKHSLLPYSTFIAHVAHRRETSNSINSAVHSKHSLGFMLPWYFSFIRVLLASNVGTSGRRSGQSDAVSQKARVA